MGIEKYVIRDVLNRLLLKPRYKKGFVYTHVDPEYLAIHGNRFLPTWDGTDHFHFVCWECKSVADVLAVKLDPNYGSDVKFALFFYLGCSRCGKTGQRKIYLDIRNDAAKFQRTFDAGSLYCYGNERAPYSVVDFIPSEVKRKLTQMMSYVLETLGLSSKKRAGIMGLASSLTDLQLVIEDRYKQQDLVNFTREFAKKGKKRRSTLAKIKPANVKDAQRFFLESELHQFFTKKEIEQLGGEQALLEIEK